MQTQVSKLEKKCFVPIISYTEITFAHLEIFFFNSTNKDVNGESPASLDLSLSSVLPGSRRLINPPNVTQPVTPSKMPTLSAFTSFYSSLF